MRQQYTYLCPQCGTEFTSRFRDRRYCSRRCSWDSHVPAPVEERFWPNVEKSEGCWIWIGPLDSNGYGVLILGGRGGQRILAHRLSWVLNVDPISDEICVLHNCPGGDNPRCVNPAHLFLGTRADNNRDMWAKGRGYSPMISHPELAAKGEQSGNAKLTDEQVREIRRLYAGGSISQAKLGQRFGVSDGTVCRIVNRVGWKHVA